ncbi:hypothetical protein P1X15_31290 [Runella sp. MFBS21]|uniref:hypothetical protein n=1 Tax=Runella sp. MFBS21 TaxID=3034018 RepID=UPI0023F6B570|nr:hypothetical protein [Runella sp. MFBS21]MDF7822141.1 hypothetical protein [Runella sp. MFBS21]
MSSIFVRKYNRAKWEQNNREYHFEETPSDAITNCIKTSGNTLSVWEITDISQIDEAILAIASGMNNLDSIDIIFLDSDFFKTNNIQYEETEGRTPVKWVHCKLSPSCRIV